MKQNWRPSQFLVGFVAGVMLSCLVSVLALQLAIEHYLKVIP